MSYYESNYYENPGPAYCESNYGAPVPGWGVEPTMAGGRRVGVGAILAPVEPGRFVMTPGRVMVPMTEGEDLTRHAGLPWWAWILITASLGAGVALARNRGYLTKVGLPR